MYVLPDVNVLVAVMNREAANHDTTRSWFCRTLESPMYVGLLPETVSGAIRVMTLPIGTARLTSAQAAGHLSVMMEDRQIVLVRPSEKQFATFMRFCRTLDLRANDAGDAMLAAAALDLNATLVSWDKGFGRFPGLTWQTPAAVQPVTNPL